MMCPAARSLLQLVFQQRATLRRESKTRRLVSSLPVPIGTWLATLLHLRLLDLPEQLEDGLPIGPNCINWGSNQWHRPSEGIKRCLDKKCPGSILSVSDILRAMKDKKYRWFDLVGHMVPRVLRAIDDKQHHWIDLVGPSLLLAIHDKKHHWIDLIGHTTPSHKICKMLLCNPIDCLMCPAARSLLQLVFQQRATLRRESKTRRLVSSLPVPIGTWLATLLHLRLLDLPEQLEDGLPIGPNCINWGSNQLHRPSEGIKRCLDKKCPGSILSVSDILRAMKYKKHRWFDLFGHCVLPAIHDKKHHWIDLVGLGYSAGYHDKKHHWIDLVGPLLLLAIHDKKHHWIDIVGPLLLLAIHDKKHHWIDLSVPFFCWLSLTRSIIGSILSVPYFCWLSMTRSTIGSICRSPSSAGYH